MAIHSTPARAGRAPGEALAGVGWQTRSGDTGRPQRSILSPAFFWSCSRSSTCAGPCGPGDASVAEKPARVCSRHLTFGSAPLSTSHARDWTAMSPSPLVACANALNHTLADLRPSRTSRAVRANICVLVLAGAACGRVDCARSAVRTVSGPATVPPQDNDAERRRRPTRQTARLSGAPS